MRMLVCVGCSVLVVGLIAAGCKKETVSSPEQGAGATAVVEQKICPVLAAPIDKNTFTEYKGRKIYFCCAMCKDTFDKDPEKYVAKVDEELKAPAK
jgi:YHS domain-containing protein